jgi:hypothetical protein
MGIRCISAALTESYAPMALTGIENATHGGERRNGMSFAARQRLLIADDDTDTLAAYVVFFEAHGFDTRAAGDGADAFCLASTRTAGRQRQLSPDTRLPNTVRGILTSSFSISRCPVWMVERWREKSDACKHNVHRCWWRSPYCHHHPKRPNRLGSASITIL